MDRAPASGLRVIVLPIHSQALCNIPDTTVQNNIQQFLNDKKNIFMCTPLLWSLMPIANQMWVAGEKVEAGT